jgi:fibronectin-binding autotransporter adhesin
MRFFLLLCLAINMLCAASADSAAADGTWIDTSGSGLWSGANNWLGNAVATGTGGTADFSTLDIAIDGTIHLDSPRNIGNLLFGDTSPSNNWTVDNNGQLSNTLNLAVSSGAPTVVVSNQTATISAILVGSQGLAMAGNGTLALSGANTYSGPTSVNSGALVLLASTTSAAGAITSGPVGTSGVVLGGSNSADASLFLGSSPGGNLANPISISSASSGSITLGSQNAAGINTFSGNITLGTGTNSGKSLNISVPGGGELDLVGNLLANGNDASAGINIARSTGSGTATVLLTGNNTFAGGTTIGSGARAILNSAGASGTGPITLNAGLLRVGTAPVYSVSGFNGDGSGWTVNNNNISSAPFPANNVLQLTDGNMSEARSAFLNAPVPVPSLSNGFTVSFIYTNTSHGIADGVAFILQNDPRGSAALGHDGGSYGYGDPSAITPSVALAMNIGNGGSPSIGWNSNGATLTPNVVTPIDFTSGDPIQVTLTYSGATNLLTETLLDKSTNATYSRTDSNINLASVLGTSTAYIGFSGATGSNSSSQQISNFSYRVGQLTATCGNSIQLAAGTTSGIEVGTSAAVATVTTGPLNVLSGTASTLNVSAASSVSANQPFALSMGNTTLAASVTLNVGNNGSGLGTLSLGAINDNGANFGITKLGSGTLALRSTSGSTYGGDTTVNGGTLQVLNSSGSATGSGPVLVSTGGNLSGSPIGAQGIISGAVTLESGGALNGTIGATLTLTGGLTLQSGSSSNFTLGLVPNGTTNPMIAVSAGTPGQSLSLGGAHSINLAGLPMVGSYALLGYSGPPLSQTEFSNFSLVTTAPAGYSYQLVNNTAANRVDLQVISTVAQLTWSGTNNGNWDVAGTQNWSTAAPASTNYVEGSAVTFNDKNPLTNSNVLNTNVTITAPSVAPQSITFNNSGPASAGVDYTVAGSISGNTIVIKNGAGTVTLGGANSFAGGTVISAGRLISSTAGSLGTGPIVLNGGALRAGVAPLFTVTGFNGNGSGWTVNNSGISSAPFPANDVLQLTDGIVSEARSAFLSTPVPVVSGTNGFTVSFTYTNPSNGIADGIAFILQNDPRGSTALGHDGGSYGYGAPSAITPSVAFAMNIGNGGSPTIGWNSGGANFTPSTISPINLASGNPIQVTLAYDPVMHLLTETLTDTVTGNTVKQVGPGIDVASALGSSTAYMGFSGATGSNTASQQISNFSYSYGSTVYANSIAVSAGATSTIEVGATQALPTVTMGPLTVAAGAPSVLNVIPATATVAVNQAYTLVLGEATLGGAVTLNVANNGSGTGTLVLGPLNDAGAAKSIAFGGPGNVILNSPAISLIAGTQILINGGALYANGVTSLGSSQVNVAAAATLALGADQTVGALMGAGSVNLGSQTLTVGGADNLASSFSGTMSGTGAIIKAGSGVLTLAGANTFSGPTTVSAGALVLANQLALQNSTLNCAGGSLDFGALTSVTLGGIAGAKSLVLVNDSSGNVALTVGNNNASTSYSGDLSGGGSIIKVGTGTLTYTGTASQTGGTTISAGVLQIGSDGTTGSLTGAVLDNGALAFNRSDTAIFTGSIAGSGNLIQAGIGALTLTGASTFSGSTTVSAGALFLGNSLALQNSTLSYGTTGGTLDFGALTSAALGGLSGAKNLALTNDLSANVALTVGNNNTSNTYSGVLSGGGSLTKVGSGTQTLSGADTFSGATVISAGKILLGNSLALQKSTLNYNNQGGTLDFGTRTSATLGGLSGSQNLALTNSSAGNVALSIGGNNADTTYSGVMSGGGSIIKVGTGALTLSGASTFTGGTTISAGKLVLDNSLALQKSILLYGSSGTLDFGTLTSATLGGMSGTKNLALTNDLSANVALTIGNNNTSNTYSGVLSGGGSLTKVGTGTETLSGADTFTGPSVISAGKILLGNSLALQNSTLNYNNQGGTLDFGTQTSATLGGLSGSQNLALTNSSLGNVGLTVGNNSADTTYSGVMGGLGSLVKTGTGTLTLSGANTFTGVTLIQGGVLQLGAANRLTSSSTLALFAGKFATGGFNQTMNFLALFSASGIDLGTGASVLRFSDSHSVNPSWTGNLSIDNWSGSLSGGGADELIFGTNNLALTVAQVSQIHFKGYDGSQILSSGEVVPLSASTRAFGDVNVDQAVNVADIRGMLMALSDLIQYQSGLTTDDVLNIADLNGDGRVSNFDAQALIVLLANSGGGSLSNAVPEPSSLLIFSIAIVVLLLRRAFMEDRLAQS